MTQMIEHVIALAVHYTRLDDRVVEARRAHDLFRRPLRLVIRRTTLRPRAQKTHQHDLLDARAPGSFDDVARRGDVNARVSLCAEFAIDTGAVSDRATAREC